MTDAIASSPLSSESVRSCRVQDLGEEGVAGLSELLSMLIDPSWVVRRAVVDALAGIGEAAVRELTEVLKSKRDNEARLAAAVDALVAARAPVESYMTALMQESDAAIVADAIQVLGRRRSQISTPLLVQLTKHENDNVAVGAIEALGRITGRAAVEALIETIGSGNFFRTFPAIDILGRSGDPRVVEPLASLLKNPTYLPEAARALGRSGEKSATGPLAAMLTSRSDSVLRVVALALAELRERFEEKTGSNGRIIDELAGKYIQPEAVAHLGRILPSCDIPEGIAVCRLLGILGSSEAVEPLTKMLYGNTEIASSAGEALKRVGKDAEEQVLRAIREGDSARRRVLLPIVSRSDAVAELALCLHDADAEVRAMACDALARTGNGKVITEIFNLLADSNMRVVHAATAAIQALGTREARQLAVVSASSDNPVVRRCALRILGYFGDDDSLRPLVAGIADTDPRVREAAIQGLPYLEDSGAASALLNAAKSPDARMRAMATRSLGQISRASQRAYSILLKALKDEDAWVRYYACQSLGRLGYTAGAVDIAVLLKDEAGQVRVSAVEALSHLDSPNSRSALRTAAKSPDADVQRAALVGLGISHRSEDLPLIDAAAKSPDVATRLIALSAITNFDSATVINTLSAAGLDSNEQVRAAAIGLLASRSESEATAALVAMLTKEETRDHARKALLVASHNRVRGILEALQYADDDSAAILISILSKIERPDARRAVLTTMKLENIAARKAAATALSARDDPETISLLRDASINDPNSEVREISLLALRS